MNSDYVIKLENDVSKEDMEFFINSFRSYNTSIIGKQENHEIKIILKNINHQIVGGVTGTAIWGWLMVNYFWIDETIINNDVYKLLLAHIENQAIRFGVKQVSLSTYDPEAKNYFETNGFKVNGVLSERPPGYNSYFLEKNQLLYQSFNLNDQIVAFTGEDVTDEDIKFLQKKIDDEHDRKLGKLLTKDVKIFARDRESKIIGGVKGYIGWGWLYLSTLWVADSYRGKGLGSELLLKAEEVALEQGIQNTFLGTTEFQARVFYEKNGYEVFAVNEDLPPGYKNFSMKKTLI